MHVRRTSYITLVMSGQLLILTEDLSTGTDGLYNIRRRDWTISIGIRCVMQHSLWCVFYVQSCVVSE